MFERLEKTVLFIDIKQSTKMKRDNDELAWLAMLEWFYELITRKMKDFESGRLVKFLGDGALIVFDQRAEEAINLAIQLQEAIENGNSPAPNEDTTRGTIAFNCSVGIAWGLVYGFEVDGKPDYIGRTVDRAARLCKAANGYAIFVDDHVIAAGDMARVVSVSGRASQRGMMDYQGEAETIELSGFKDRVGYREIFWSNKNFGVDKEFISQPSEDSEASDHGFKPVVTANNIHFYLGLVDHARFNGNFGFITMPNLNKPMFFGRDTIIGTLTPNDEIACYELGSNAQGICASKVVFLGRRIGGQVSVFYPDRNFGFLSADNLAGEQVSFWFHGTQLKDAVTQGQQVEFEPRLTPKGLHAIKITQPKIKAATGLEIGATEEGIVKAVRAGFGFIDCDGVDVFYAENNVDPASIPVGVGEAVSFTVIAPRPGATAKYAAENVRKL